MDVSVSHTVNTRVPGGPHIWSVKSGSFCAGFLRCHAPPDEVTGSQSLIVHV